MIFLRLLSCFYYAEISSNLSPYWSCFPMHLCIKCCDSFYRIKLCD